MKDPIDYNSPLGISKSEWTKVLGVNLALLLLIYSVATIFTLCGSDLFLSGLDNSSITNLTNRLNEWGIYPLLTISFATIEEMIMIWFILLKRPRWWVPVSYFSIRVLNNLIFLWSGASSVPTWSAFVINIISCLVFVFLNGRKFPKPLIRFAIVIAVSLLMNGIITIFRTKILEIDYKYTEVVFVYLSLEYDIAFGLALGFMSLAIPWEKGANKQCYPMSDAGGSSPNTKNSLPKNSKIAKTDLPAKYKKRLRWLKAKVIAIQTIALIVIAALPWFTGRPVEFALVYASFCMTRICLGFNRSLHFKSELSCVTIGALTFWGLTYLAPSAEASIIMSMIYGAGLALGFRLYWELHDLLMYHKAAKTDRYAMFYTVFKGNIDPRHINGYMRMKGYSEKNDISMVQMYMQRDKVEYIGQVLSYARITIEKRLTEIATDLYARR